MNGVKVVPIEGKGRGAVAEHDFNQGAVIEVVPVHPFDHTQAMPKELDDLPFEWDDGRDAIAFGAVQFCNHADNPNCELDRDFEGNTMALVAIRDITAGEELTIEYGIPLWFTKV